MDVVLGTEMIEADIKLVQDVVKQEVIDTDYDHPTRRDMFRVNADRNYSICNNQVLITDCETRQNIQRCENESVMHSGKNSIDSKAIVVEDIKVETEVIRKENMSGLVLKQELSEAETDLNDTVAESDNKSGLQEEILMLYEDSSYNRNASRCQNLGSISTLDESDIKHEQMEPWENGNSKYAMKNIENEQVERKKENNNTCEKTEMGLIEPALDENVNEKDTEKLPKSCGLMDFSNCKDEMSNNLEADQHSCAEKKGYKCKICKKTFSKKSSLSSHEITHTGETPFKCQFCCKGFNVRSNLNVHLRIHTGQRPHVCEICQKTFRQAGQLKSHDRIHKGEKPYTCVVCTRSFRNSSALITHQRTHTGERPFPCDLCSRSFSTSTSLKTHRITHSGTMLYDCPVCGRQFNRKNNLNVHIKRHNKNRKFSCPKCSNGFVMRAHLLGHLKRAHKLNMSSEKELNELLDSCEETAEISVIKSEFELEIKTEEDVEKASNKGISNNFGHKLKRENIMHERSIDKLNMEFKIEDDLGERIVNNFRKEVKDEGDDDNLVGNKL